MVNLVLPRANVEETIERRLLALERESYRNFKTVEDMDHVLNGNGQPGLVVEMRNFIAEQRGSIRERAKQIESLKWLVTTTIALLVLVIAYLAYLHATGTARAVLKTGDVSEQTALSSQQNAVSEPRY